MTSQRRIDERFREVHAESQAEVLQKVSVSGEKTGVLVRSILLSQRFGGF